MNTLKITTTFFCLVFLSWLVIISNDNNNNIATAKRVLSYSPKTVENNINYKSINNNADVMNLTSRLDTSGGLVECWTALLELKSCSNEIVLFFLNGQTDIGPGCCRAIVFITRRCWPAMLTSLGFTVEEGDVLRGYCDALEAHDTPPISGPSPAPLAEHPQQAVDLAKLPLD